MSSIRKQNSLLDSQKHCGINFRGSHIIPASIKNHFYKLCKVKKVKKLGQLDENTAINGYLYAAFCLKKLFKVQKSFTYEAQYQKSFIASSNGNFTFSLLG